MILYSERLSIFKRIFTIERYDSLEHSYTFGFSLQCYGKNDLVDYIENDLYFIFNDEKLNSALLNFIDIIQEEYGDINPLVLFEALNNHIKATTYTYFENQYQGQSKEEVYKLILNKGFFFSESMDGYKSWYIDYLNVLLKYLKSNKMSSSNSVKQLLSEIKEFENKQKLKLFKNNLLKRSEEIIHIEDIDLMNGFEFEDFLSQLFTKMGYKVEQTKLSGDQGADLILERNSNKTVVQAKCYSGKIGNKAVQEVVASIKHYKAENGMIVTNSSFTPSAIKLADSNNIRLVDRKKLDELIQKYMNGSQKEELIMSHNEMISYEEIKKGKFSVTCRNCHDSIIVDNKNLPIKNQDSMITCPKCNVKVVITLCNEEYLCPACKKEFRTISEKMGHLEKCDKFKNKK